MAKWFTFPGKKGEMVVESTFSTGKCTKKAGKRDQRGLAGPFFGADTKKNREHVAVFCGERGIRTPGTVTGTTV